MAYAAITCLMSTIDQSMQLTGCNLQSFYKKLESLRANLDKPWKVTDDLEALTSLEAKIAQLAYKTEDMVGSESRKVVFAKLPISKRIAIWKLHSLLSREVGRIGSTMKKWIGMLDRHIDSQALKAQNLTLVGTSQHALEPESMMVGHENEFEMMQDQLARGGRELEVVSIVGMGGIGKTTLATKIYSDPFIMSRFEIRAKVTISQEYCASNVLLGLLSYINGSTDESHGHQEDWQLADRLQKLLKGGRYLVVIDDIWTTKAWDEIKLCFPDCNNGSRILLTTRNVEVAEYASLGKPPCHMHLMNFDESWNLLQEKVFEKECSSPDFEKIGKQIALKCGGLPLAIVVIAGLLSKIGKELDEWQSVVENVSSVVSTDLEAQCMRVLALSYHHLPSYLKPCFLYFAIFPEDKLIFVDKLVELWVVEGFLKVEEVKSTEEVAEKCLKELIDRNLISIHRLRFDGEIESCGMHDVIRELCLREARNMNFVNILGGKSDQNPSMHFSSVSRGRISIQLNMSDLIVQKISARYPNNEIHSIICLRKHWYIPKFPFKLVRVLDLGLISLTAFPGLILDLIHLRYLSLSLYPGLEMCEGEEFPSSISIPQAVSNLCYLQTFILKLSPNEAWKYPFILPSEILTMLQLRHLRLDWNYLWKHELTEKRLVLKNLQSLDGWNPRYCTESLFRLFPNIKKLQICGTPEDFRSRKDLYDFGYLDQLKEMEFCLTMERKRQYKHLAPADSLLLPPADAFPQNLKKLSFSQTHLQWKNLNIVSKLPKLEALTLAYDACKGEVWEGVDEGFPSLKFLLLDYLDIRFWRASSDHFPCLERLFLDCCWNLDSIPRDFADITTLSLIDIIRGSQSSWNSAKQIQQDVQDIYASSLELHIRPTFFFFYRKWRRS